LQLTSEADFDIFVPHKMILCESLEQIFCLHNVIWGWGLPTWSPCARKYV